MIKRETLKKWEQDCRVEKRRQLTPMARFSIALPLLLFLVAMPLFGILSESGALPAFVAEHLGFSMTLIFAAFLASLFNLSRQVEKSKRRSIPCSRCGNPMLNIVVDRPVEDVAAALGRSAAWLDTRTFRNGRTGWKINETGSRNNKVVTRPYWQVPRELWRACIGCQRAFLAEKETPGARNMPEPLNSTIDHFAQGLPFRVGG